jgi:hypothetical protein
MQDGEAESYRNVEVEFVPGRQAKMTIYEDGVIANGEEAPIDMTLLVTKEDMHKLMVDKGFEKLTAAELEVRKLEQSKLFPSSTSSTSTTKRRTSRCSVRATSTREKHQESREEERRDKRRIRNIRVGAGPATWNCCKCMLLLPVAA